MHKEELQNLLDEDYRNKKAAELQALPSSIDKIRFWNKLGFSWLEQNQYDSFEGIPLAPFRFKVPKQEFKEVNEWIIKNYLKLSWEEEKEKRLLSLDRLINDFEWLLEMEATDRRDYILKKQMLVDKAFESAVTVKSTGLFRQAVSVPLGYSKEYFASAETFYAYLRYGQLPNYGEIIPHHVGSVLMAENGVTLAKYRKYLEESLSGVQEEKDENDKVTRAQKVLLLHSLGILDLLKERIPVQANLTKVLQRLIGAHADNIKKDLQMISNNTSKVWSKENIEFVASTLDLGKLDKEAEEIRIRLAELYRAEKKK